MGFIKSMFNKKEKNVKTKVSEDKKSNEDGIFKEAVKYSLEAELAYKKGDFKESEKLCKKAISLNRKLEKVKTPTPYERIAVILKKEGNFKEALKYIEEYLQYQPTNSKFLQYKEKLTYAANNQIKKA